MPTDSEEYAMYVHKKRFIDSSNPGVYHCWRNVECLVQGTMCETGCNEEAINYHVGTSL